jgi:outer membrane protein OmpA-like peptidoglycan-associated protein
MSGNQNATLTIEAEGVSKSGSTTFEVKSGGNPRINVAVSPSTIEHGASAQIQPNATASECGGQVRVTCTASEGTVTNTTFDSSTVAFDPNATKEQSKTVTITCTATDSLGGTATGNATVTVTEKPNAHRLDDLVFGKGSARVNNCAKRLLLEEATALVRDNPDWTLILVGHRDEQETGRPASTLDRSRAMNAAAVLSAGKGICPALDLSRVKVLIAGTDQSAQPRPSFCGTSTQVKERAGQAVNANDPRAQFRRVEVWLIPTGAAVPAALQNAQPIDAAAVKRLGCPH